MKVGPLEVLLLSQPRGWWKGSTRGPWRFWRGRWERVGGKAWKIFTPWYSLWISWRWYDESR